MDTPTAIVSSVAIGGTIMGGVVTYIHGKSSNQSMDRIPSDLLQNLSKLAESNQAVLI